jgi:hypothetical protein
LRRRSWSHAAFAPPRWSRKNCCSLWSMFWE